MGKEFFKKSVVELMAGFVDHQMAQDRHTEKRKITQAIKDFVANELVRIAQSIFVDDTVVVDDNRIVQ